MGNQQLAKEELIMPMTKEQFEKRMKEKFSNENYEIIKAGRINKDISVLKCLSCGKIIEVNTGELFRSRRKYVCGKCSAGPRKDTLKNREIIKEKLKDKGKDIEFFMKKQSQNGNFGDAVRFTCLSCGEVNEYFVGNLIKYNSKCECSHCTGAKNRKNEQDFLRELENKYPNKFTLLNHYENVGTNLLIKCNDCGFVRKVKPTILLKAGYCPKCGKEVSIGEKVIREWLESHNIYYEPQKYFKDWQIGVHYFDFYIPDFNLVIEFHGRQHYEFVEHFHKTLENFEYRKNKDKLKEEAALNHGINYLSFKYVVLDDIPKYLNKIASSTTISNESRGKYLEIDSVFDKDEDIVWSSSESQSSS